MTCQNNLFARQWNAKTTLLTNYDMPEPPVWPSTTFLNNLFDHLWHARTTCLTDYGMPEQSVWQTMKSQKNLFNRLWHARTTCLTNYDMAEHPVRYTTTCQNNLFDRLDNDMPEQEYAFYQWSDCKKVIILFWHVAKYAICQFKKATIKIIKCLAIL